MARRTRSRFVRPPKKTVMWIGDATTLVAVPGNSVVLLSTLNAAALALRPFTVMRTRGFVHWESDQVAASEQTEGIYGEIVVTDSATTAGIASIPDPLSDPTASWFVFEPVFQRFLFTDATGSHQYGGAGSVWRFDSKAMRKVGFDDDVAGVFVNGTASGANGLVNARTLIQLH